MNDEDVWNDDEVYDEVYEEVEYCPPVPNHYDCCECEHWDDINGCWCGVLSLEKEATKKS